MERHDLKIAGTGTASGGVYNDVVINGEGKISGDLDCIDFKINGVTNVNGSLKAKTVKINGEAKMKGNLEAEDFKINGNSDIRGNVVVKDARIKGSAGIGGGIKAEEFESEGVLKVQGDCNAEFFLSKGAFNIGGLLNAGSIDITMFGNCQVREIGGEKIKIKKGADFKLIKIIKSIFMPSDFYDGRLDTETIEGDDIYLEYTRAKVVRGSNVNIGKGCEIELVEYENNFQQDREAKVNDSKKINQD